LRDVTCSCTFLTGTPLGLLLLKTVRESEREEAKGRRKNLGFIFVYNFNISFVQTQRARSFLSFECFISFLSQPLFFSLLRIVPFESLFFSFIPFFFLLLLLLLPLYEISFIGSLCGQVFAFFFTMINLTALKQRRKKTWRKNTTSFF
jgi:hypothetical protein